MPCGVVAAKNESGIARGSEAESTLTLMCGQPAARTLGRSSTQEVTTVKAAADGMGAGGWSSARKDRVSTATLALAGLLGVGYIAAGVVGAAADATGGDGSDLAFWLVFLVGGGALVLIGSFLFGSRPMPSVVLTSVGALAGALALFWSVIVPVLALALVVLSVVRARRSALARRRSGSHA
ncbi:MAG: hypothetical protein HW413_2367 [Thermoleophilia bacterium]|nr:hypothetical protein [Thermoleophilia bacterium]